MSYPGIQISRLGSAVFVPKNFSALLTRDIRNIGNCIFFAEQKKSNGAAGEKKFRVRCKNLAFYSTESHIESFFAEQKRENGAAGKKKIEVQPGWCGQQPSSPWYSRGSTMGFFFFFFFFFLFSRLLLRRNRTLYGSGAPDVLAHFRHQCCVLFVFFFFVDEIM